MGDLTFVIEEIRMFHLYKYIHVNNDSCYNGDIPDKYINIDVKLFTYIVYGIYFITPGVKT